MNKAIVNKILITLAFLFAYRVLAYIPIPGVDAAVIKDFFRMSSSNALGLFNMFSGGAVERISIITLGIMPYITASIIMELLAATFAPLAKMKKDGATVSSDVLVKICTALDCKLDDIVDIVPSVKN